MSGVWILAALAVVGFLQVCNGQACDDIDTHACQLMVQQNPNLCQSNALALSACPRFCNKCPLQCYHCDVSVRDYTSCNTTKTCQTDEQCMLRELSSSGDGHHEYVMMCATIQMCDGDMGGVVPFGKRDVESRDISSKCCIGDMCNYPESMTTTTTFVMTTTMPATTASVTACSRDISFVVEDNSRRSAAETHTIVTFLKNIVRNIQIGKHDNLVSLTTFDSDNHDKIHFNQNQTQSDLLHQLHQLKFHDSEHLVDYGNLVLYLDHHIDGLNDPRQASKNVVVIFIDHYAKATGTNHHGLHLNGDDVVVVDIGSSSAMTLFNSMALDSNHVIAVPHFPSLNNYLSQLMNLICM